MRRLVWTFCLGALALTCSRVAEASPCDDPQPGWLMCEDFEQGGLGWDAWFDQSSFVECIGCPDPNRILLFEDPATAHDGDWSLHMPAAAEANYTGGALTFRTCNGTSREGCMLTGYDELYFRTWVKLAADHQYVHHFLSIDGTQPDEYWGADGNAGCRPNGYRAAGTTLDFDSNRELFFYTYFPDMTCDMGGYCDGEYAQSICDGCAQKDMPCENGLECCWGNLFAPDPPVELARDEWVCLELHMHINTPGVADGTMSFWVDETLALEQTGMHWRDIAELQLNKAWLQHYIADGDATQSNRVWFDDVVVSTERIGCSLGGDGDGDGDGDPGDGDSTSAESESGGPAGTDAGTSEGCACSTREPTPRAGAWLVLLVGLCARRRPRQNSNFSADTTALGNQHV